MRLPVRAGRHAVVGCRAEGHRPGGVVLGHGSVKGRSPPWLCNFTLLCYVPQRGGGDRNALHVPSGIPQLPGDSPPHPAPPSPSGLLRARHLLPAPRSCPMPRRRPARALCASLSLLGSCTAQGSGDRRTSAEGQPAVIGRARSRLPLRAPPRPRAAAASLRAPQGAGGLPHRAAAFGPRGRRRTRGRLSLPRGRLRDRPFRRQPAITPGGPLPDGAAHPGRPRFPGGRAPRSPDRQAWFTGEL